MFPRGFLRNAPFLVVLLLAAGCLWACNDGAIAVEDDDSSDDDAADDDSAGDDDTTDDDDTADDDTSDELPYAGTYSGDVTMVVHNDSEDMEFPGTIEMSVDELGALVGQAEIDAPFGALLATMDGGVDQAGLANGEVWMDMLGDEIGPFILEGTFTQAEFDLGWSGQIEVVQEDPKEFSCTANGSKE